jgi:hypothetical protein
VQQSIHGILHPAKAGKDKLESAFLQSAFDVGFSSAIIRGLNPGIAQPGSAPALGK